MRGQVITVQHRQCIYDIAAQYYGSKDGVILLLLDNPELPGLDTRLTAGQKLQIKQSPINVDVVNYYKKNGIVPVTEVEQAFFDEDVVLVWGSGDDDTIGITDYDELKVA